MGHILSIMLLSSEDELDVLDVADSYQFDDGFSYNVA